MTYYCRCILSYFFQLIFSKAMNKISWHIIHREKETKFACDCGLIEMSVMTELQCI